MTRVLVQALIIIAVPTFVFVGGAWLMSEISGRALPANQTPEEKAAELRAAGDTHCKAGRT